MPEPKEQHGGVALVWASAGCPVNMMTKIFVMHCTYYMNFRRHYASIFEHVLTCNHQSLLHVESVGTAAKLRSKHTCENHSNRDGYSLLGGATPWVQGYGSPIRMQVHGCNSMDVEFKRWRWCYAYGLISSFRDPLQPGVRVSNP